jgi:electron transfer flavoprotein alpha subunit
MGKNLDAVAKSTATVTGVSKVLVLESDVLDQCLAEDLAAALVQVAPKYTHILAASSNHGKNFIPRAAALLDSQPLMDVLAVVDENTFKRPMYAGNAIATLSMSNALKFLLVRPTAFEKAEVGTGTGTLETVSLPGTIEKSPLSTFVSLSTSESTRPDLGAARVVVSGE